MKKTTTIIFNGRRPNSIGKKVIAITALAIIGISIWTSIILNYANNKKFAEDINNFAKLNAKTVFSIDKIYMYSSAGATENKEDRPVWNLNINQYTDIALYINNRSEQTLNYENAIKNIYIENIRFSGFEQGKPSLYYKDINDFGKLSVRDENKIEDRLDFKVINDGEINYSEAQIYADCLNPITVQYVNKDIKTNEIISDISTDVIYDGSLLRKTGVILSKINCVLAFDVIIFNFYNQKFIANVYIDIPLEDTDVGTTIYDGKFVKKLENTNLIKFFRVE